MLREGGRHSYWGMDAERSTSVPRHREIHYPLARAICRSWGFRHQRVLGSRVATVGDSPISLRVWAVFWVGGSIAEAVTQGGPVGWFFVFTSGLFAFFVLRGIKVFWQIAVVFGVVGTLLIPARPGPCGCFRLR